LPFRQAHEVIGKLVLYCIQNKKYLLDLQLEEFHQFSDLFGADIYEVLQPEHVVNARNVFGGTARVQVEHAIERCEQAFAGTKDWVESHLEK
jgi:argininosuccinate lyase